ncbi:MAG: hypothetical protein AAGF20_07690 [Pseudomonadota bacterium]
MPISQSANAICNVIGGAAIALAGTGTALAVPATGIAAGAAAGAVSGGMIPLAVGSVSLIALWRSARRAKSIDNTKDLSAITKKVRARFQRSAQYDLCMDYEMKDAEDLLMRALGDIVLSPQAVAQTAVEVERGGFPTAATAKVLDALKTWCASDKAKPGDAVTYARTEAFLTDVFTEGFQAAIQCQDYFDQFKPELLVTIAQEVARTRDGVQQILDKLIEREDARTGNYEPVVLQITATRDEMRAGFEALGDKIDAVGEGVKAIDEKITGLERLFADYAQYGFAIEEAKLTYQELLSRYGGDEAMAKTEFRRLITTARERNALVHRADNIGGDVAETADQLDDLSAKDGQAAVNAQLVRLRADRETLARQKSTLEEREQQLQQGEALLLALGIKQDLLALDPGAAAAKEWQKIQLERPEPKWTAALWTRQSVYVEEGERTGARLDLQVSLALCDIGSGASSSAEDRAGHHNNRANALQVLGSRTGGSAGQAYLEQAVAGYDAALTVRTEDEMPAKWAMTQQNRAIALRVLGERTGGSAGQAYLEQAVAGYDAALRVRTEGEMPAQWATTQQNRANALQVLGSRTGGSAGQAYLDEAVAGYDAALTVQTEGDMPAQWAGTQQNRANALGDLGELIGGEEGARLLQGAIEAYGASLRVQTKDTMPAFWAQTKENIAITELQLLRVKGDASALDRAEAAAQDAMSVYAGGGMTYDQETCQRLLDGIATLKAGEDPN